LGRELSKFCSVFLFQDQAALFSVLPLKTTALRLFETFDFSAAFGSPKMSVSGDLNLCFWDENCQNFVVSFFFRFKQLCSLFYP
jgi:hypothetical protein